ncbi:RNA polymerase sigma-70 factor [uncultured Alistipes sp.]|uniref:RNA polymerase sigma-70 factor n=1 Tax=uncultured Alistipes sp. TaxID=538949 RepID=UPI0026652B8D|nr:RNA polymerase sigma-70 factor [uncultured Alistipes sp.]
MTAAEIQDNRRVVDLLRRGDEACFDALFRRYYKPLCAYASRFVAVDRAEELVQDTLMWVWESRDKLLPEMPLKSLLFTIVKNKSLNSVARDTIRSKIIRQLAEQYEAQFDDPDFYLENELADRLAAALRKMPPEFQETFRMHRLEGMTHKEIASALGVSPQTVNYRIGQTVRTLREELKEYWPLLVLLLGQRLS